MEKKEYRNRIRVILAEKMITNTYLAEQLGVSKMTISRWCTNTTQPSAPQLIEISQILQCDLKDLYEENIYIHRLVCRYWGVSYSNALCWWKMRFCQ